MHSILWVSVGVSAGVAIITTVLVDFLFKPGLEARKERILEKSRDKRKAIKGIWQAWGLLGQLQLHKKHAPYEIPKEYLRTVTEQFSEKVDAVFDVLNIPESIGGQWDRAAAIIQTFAFEVQVGEIPEEEWQELESATEVLYDFYHYFKARRWRLLYRRMIIKDIKSYPTYETQKRQLKTRKKTIASLIRRPAGPPNERSKR
jgi:hypothetical protein